MLEKINKRKGFVHLPLEVGADVNIEPPSPRR